MCLGMSQLVGFCLCSYFHLFCQNIGFLYLGYQKKPQKMEFLLAFIKSCIIFFILLRMFY